MSSGDDLITRTNQHVAEAVRWIVAVANGITDESFDEVILRTRNATALFACAITAAVDAAENKSDESAASFVEALRLQPSALQGYSSASAVIVSFDRYIVLELCIVGLRRGLDAFFAAAEPAGGAFVFRFANAALQDIGQSLAGCPSWLLKCISDAFTAAPNYEHPSRSDEPFETLLGHIQVNHSSLRSLVDTWPGRGPGLHLVHDIAEVRRLCDCIGGPSVFYQRWRAFAPIYEEREKTPITSLIADHPLPIALLYRPPFWFSAEETVLRHGAAPVVTVPCMLGGKCYVLHSYSQATTMCLNDARASVDPGTRSDFATEYEFCGLLSPHLALVRSEGACLHFADPTVLLPGGALATLAEIAALHGRVATATPASWPQMKLTFIDDHVSCGGELVVNPSTGVQAFRFGEVAASKLFHNSKLTVEDPDFDPLNSSFASDTNTSNQSCLRLQSVRIDTKFEVISWMLRNNAPVVDLPCQDMSLVAGVISQEVIAGLSMYVSLCDDNVNAICSTARDFAQKFFNANVLMLVLDAVATDAGSCSLLESIEERADDFTLASVAHVLGIRVAAAMACVLARRGGAADIIDTALEAIPEILSVRFPQGLSLIAAACRGGQFEAAKKMFAKLPAEEHVVTFLDATNMAFFFAAGDPQAMKRVGAEWMPIAKLASPSFRPWTGNPFAAMSSATALRGRLKFNATPSVDELQLLLEHRLQLFISDSDVADLCAVLREWQQFNMAEAKAPIEACIRCVFDHPRTNLQHLLRSGVIKKLPKGCKRIGEMLLLMASSVKCCTIEAVGNVLLPLVNDPLNNPFKYPLHLALSLSTRDVLSHEFTDAGKRFWESPSEGTFDDATGCLSRTDALKFPNVGALSFTLIKCHQSDPQRPQSVVLNVEKSVIIIANASPGNGPAAEVVLRISKFSPMLPGVLRNIVELSADAVAFAFVYPSPEKALLKSVAPTLLDSLIINGGLAMIDKKRKEVVDLVALTDAGNDMLFEGPFIVEPTMESTFREHAWRDVRVDPKSLSAKKTWEGRLSRVGIKRYQWMDSDVIAPMGGFVFDMGDTEVTPIDTSPDHSLALQTSRVEDSAIAEDPFALITVAGSLIFNPPPERQAPPRFVYFAVNPNPPADGGAVNAEAVSLAVEVVKALIDARDQWAEMFCATPPLSMGCVYPLLSVLHLINSTPLELAVRLHCLPVIQAILQGPNPHVLWQVHDTSLSAEGQPLATSSQLLTEAIRLMPLSSFDLRSFTNIAQSTALSLKLPVEHHFCRGEVSITVDETTDRLFLVSANGHRPQQVTQPEVIDPIDEQRPVSSRVAFALPTEGSCFPHGALVYLDWSNVVLRADAFVPPIQSSPATVPQASPTTTHIPMPPFEPKPSGLSSPTATEYFNLVGPVDASYVKLSDVLWSSRPSCPRVILNSLPKSATVLQWGWLPPGSAPCATPSGAFVLQMSNSMLHAFAIASEVRVWEPRRASRNGADKSKAQQAEPQQWVGDPLPRPLVGAREAVVRTLIEHCIEHGDGFGLYSDNGKVDVTVLALLLQYGAENLALLSIPHVAEKVAEFTNTSVDALLRLNDESRVAMLFPTGVIEATGFCVHVMEDRGLSLLHWAALFGSVPLLKTVLGIGSKGREMGRLLSAEAATSRTAKFTALHFAAYSGSVECIKILLDFKPMREAINLRSVPTWLLLRKVQTSHEEDGHTGPTALHIAAFFLNMNTIEALVSNGADPTLTAEVGAPQILVNPYCVLLIRQYVNAQYDIFDEGSIDLPMLRAQPKIKTLIETVSLKLGLLLMLGIVLLLALVLWYHNLLTAPDLLDTTFQQGFAAIEAVLTIDGVKTKEDFQSFVESKLWSAVASSRTGPLWTTAGYETVASLFLAMRSDCVNLNPTTFTGLAGTEAIVNVENRIRRPVTVRSPSSDIVYSWQDFDWVRVTALSGATTLPPGVYTIAPNVSVVLNNFFKDPLTASVGSCNAVAAAMLPVAHRKAGKVYIYVIIFEMLRSGLTTVFIREEGLPIGQLSYATVSGQQRAVAEGLLCLVFILSLCRIGKEIAGAVSHWITIVQPPEVLRWPRTTALSKDKFLKHLDVSVVVRFIISRLMIPTLLACFTCLMLSYGVDVFANYPNEITLLDTYDDTVKAAANFSPDILVVTWLIRSIRLTASYFLFFLTTALTYSFVFIPRVGPYLALMRVIGSLKVVVFLAMGAAIAFSFALSMYVAYPGVSDLRSLRLAFLKSILSINSGWQLQAEGEITVDSDTYNFYYICFNYYVALVYVVLMWVAIWSDFDRGQQEVHEWWTCYLEGWYKEWLLVGHNDASQTVNPVSTSEVQINHERAVFAKLA